MYLYCCWYRDGKTRINNAAIRGKKISIDNIFNCSLPKSA
jgi:hypothetical protein